MSKTRKDHLLIAIGLTLTFIFLIFFLPIWERSPGGLWIIPVFLGILITFIAIVIKIIGEIVRLTKVDNSRNYSQYFPLIILIVLNWVTAIQSSNVEEFHYGKVIFQACYEGTQNQATFKLRDKNNFEIHYTGAFFANSFVTGTYEKSGDTLYLSYRKKHDKHFGQEVYMDKRSEYLIPVKNDSLQISQTNFYFGLCKGLN